MKQRDPDSNTTPSHPSESMLLEAASALMERTHPAAGMTDMPEQGWNVKPSDIAPEASDPLLGCLVALSRHYGIAHSVPSLISGLPLEDNRLTPSLFMRAAERAGFSARMTNRCLEKIPDNVLPAVLLLRNREAVVFLRRLNASEGEVLLPETGIGAQVMPLSQLAASYIDYVIFLRPQVRYRDLGREDMPKSQGSWFWDTLRKFRTTYCQVMVAALLVNLFALAGPMFSMNVYDRVVPNNAVETLWVLVTGITVIYVFDFLLKTLRSYFVDNAGKRADVIMSSRIFEQVMNLRMQARPGSSGVFANRLKEFEIVREFFTSATVTALIDVPFIFLFLAVIWIMAGPVALIPALAVPLVIGISLLMQVPLKRAVQESIEDNAQKHGVVVEVISALDTIKCLGAEGKMQKEWENFAGHSAQTSVKIKFLSGLGLQVSTFIQQMVTVGVIIVGVYQIRENAITMGAVIACSILSGRVMAPLAQIASLLSRLNHSLSARRSIDEIMNLPVDRPADAHYLSRPNLVGTIVMNNVTFTYEGNPLPSLNHIDMKISAGEHVAIMGPVGSGKSTLSRLITRLYEPQEGELLIDGTDIRQLDPADIRRSIGCVLQDVILFHGTVRDNIAMAAPEADDTMIFRAAHQAGVHDFISRHPLGYDMVVGERGQTLSGGQRQSIAVARALLPDPPILILDEPTSMMDMASERSFMTRLRPLITGKTVILITHRPSLLSLVDRIIVLSRGQIVADGPRDVILRGGGTRQNKSADETSLTLGIPQRPAASAPVTIRPLSPTARNTPPPPLSSQQNDERTLS